MISDIDHLMKNQLGVDGWTHAVHGFRPSEHVETLSCGEERLNCFTNDGDEFHRLAVAANMDSTKPASEPGEDFVADGVRIGGEVVNTVMRADKIYEPFRVQPAFRHVGNIESDEIHRDTSYDGNSDVVDKSGASIAERSRIAIAVTDSDGSYKPTGRNTVGSTVANRCSSVDVT